jgi:hypothetical protein
MLRAASLAGLIVFTVVPASAAQRETAPSEIPSRTFLVNVAQGPTRFTGGPNERYLTFNMPVEVPGARLVAGTYLFRLVGTSVLQVMSADRSRVYTAFITIRADGDGDMSRERIKFQQFDEDRPLRIVAWYPAESHGYEFLYTKSKGESVDRRER